MVTKQARHERASRILAMTRVGSRLRTEDELFIRELILSHPDAEQKVGIGVMAVRVMATRWGGKAFVIVRRDGSRTDFSFRKCLNAPTHWALVSSAAREEIARDVVAFKAKTFLSLADEDGRILCPVTGKRVSFHESHVDHEDPPAFRAILLEFLDTRCITAEDVAIEQGGDLNLVTRMADRAMAEDWRGYHRDRARLRIIDADANIRLGSQVRG